MADLARDPAGTPTASRPWSEDAAYASRQELSCRTFAIGLALIAVVYLAQGLYLARVLIPSHDQTASLFVGYLAASGRISLYQDELAGHRPPLPSYILGATQRLWGRSLLAARLLTVGFGVILVVLTGLLGRRLGGKWCGLLSAAFLTAQGAIVGYYSMGDYHALVPMVMVAGFLVWLWRETPASNVAGAAVVGSLFFLRVHVWPLLPVVFLLALRRARSSAERVLVGAVMIVPPLVFLLWDLRHLKLLLSMPLVGRLVRRLGYLPFTLLDERPYQPFWTQVLALLHLARRYEFLLLATVVVAMLVAWRLRRGGPGLYFGNPRVNLLAALFAYNLACLFVFFRINFKWIGIYVTSLVPLLAVVLGYLVTRLARDPGLPHRLRVVLGVGLALALVLPIYYNRNPLMPIGALRAADPMHAVVVAGEHLARLVPSDAKVFFFGQLDVFYLSGLPPTHLQQITNYDTLAVNDEDNRVTMRSGYYGMSQVERWLGSEDGYAVVSPEGLQTFAEDFHHHPDVTRPKVARMRELLSRYFVRVGTVDEYPYYSYEVYRRVGGPDPAPAAR